MEENNKYQNVQFQTFLGNAKLDDSLKGQPPRVRKTDPASEQNVYDASGFVEVFDLSKPEDVEEYAKVLAQAINKQIEVVTRRQEWSDKTDNFKVLCEWFTLTVVPRNKG